ncbi:MAG TPA: tetratricopeptide repeat protein, partial [Pirellulales bacterium]
IEQDVVLGVKFLEEAERAGSKVAGDELGRLYFHGKVVNKNAITAVHWFRRAAEGDDGYGPAKLHLAKCYLSGEGVKRNPSEASRWLKSAAEQPGRIGAEAMYLLGWLAEKGVGGTVDAPEALKWYYKSAVAGYAEALAKVKALCAELQAILPS